MKTSDLDIFYYAITISEKQSGLCYIVNIVNVIVNARVTKINK